MVSVMSCKQLWKEFDNENKYQNGTTGQLSVLIDILQIRKNPGTTSHQGMNPVRLKWIESTNIGHTAEHQGISNANLSIPE